MSSRWPVILDPHVIAAISTTDLPALPARLLRCRLQPGGESPSKVVSGE
jgi:hypothetical protein